MQQKENVDSSSKEQLMNRLESLKNQLEKAPINMDLNQMNRFVNTMNARNTSDKKTEDTINLNDDSASQEQPVVNSITKPSENENTQSNLRDNKPEVNNEQKLGLSAIEKVKEDFLEEENTLDLNAFLNEGIKDNKHFNGLEIENTNNFEIIPKENQNTYNAKIAEIDSKRDEHKQQKPRSFTKDHEEILKLIKERDKIIGKEPDEKDKLFVENITSEDILKNVKENLEQLKPQIEFFQKLDECKKSNKLYDNKIFDEFKKIKQEVPEHLNICDKAMERFPEFNKHYDLYKNGNEHNQELKNAYNPQHQQYNQTQINSGNNVQVIIIGQTPPNLEFIANYLNSYASQTNDPYLKKTLEIAGHNVQDAANVVKENKNNITGQNCNKVIDTVNKIVTTQVMENLNQTKQMQPIVNYANNFKNFTQSQTQEQMNANINNLQNSKMETLASSARSLFTTNVNNNIISNNNNIIASRNKKSAQWQYNK